MYMRITTFDCCSFIAVLNYPNKTSQERSLLVWGWCAELNDIVYIMHTYSIHSVVVQNFVSGRACYGNQYHYESPQRRVVKWLFTQQAIPDIKSCTNTLCM